MKCLWPILLACALVIPAPLLMPGAVSASPTATIYAGDFPGWQSAVNNVYAVEDFADATLNPGVSVDSDLGEILVDYGLWWDELDYSGGPATITTWTFAFPIYAFGGTWDAGSYRDYGGHYVGGPGSNIEVLMDGAWVSVGVIDNEYIDVFWGFVSDVPFTQVRLQAYNAEGWTERYTLDNMVYARATLWGVDSYSHITQSFYDSVKAVFGAPDFWGRYIGDDPSFPKDMDLTEVQIAHTNGFAILPIYFNYKQNKVKGYDRGQDYAKSAIKDAQQRLHIPEGVAIFVDIEGVAHVRPDEEFIRGWYDRFNSTFTYTIKGTKYTYQAGYYKAGYYANTRTTSNFYAPFCAAVKLEPEIATNSFIWTNQPCGYVSADTTKISAPSYNPIAVSCPGQQIPIPAAWQYAIQNPNQIFPPNVDLDEASTSLPLWYP